MCYMYMYMYMYVIVVVITTFIIVVLDFMHACTCENLWCCMEYALCNWAESCLDVGKFSIGKLFSCYWTLSKLGYLYLYMYMYMYMGSVGTFLLKVAWTNCITNICSWLQNHQSLETCILIIIDIIVQEWGQLLTVNERNEYTRFTLYYVGSLDDYACTRACTCTL